VVEAVELARSRAATGWTPRGPRLPPSARETVFGPAYDATHVYTAGALDYPGWVPVEGAFVGGLGFTFGSRSP
jgi:hypothetical protein